MAKLRISPPIGTKVRWRWRGMHTDCIGVLEKETEYEWYIRDKYGMICRVGKDEHVIHLL